MPGTRNRNNLPKRDPTAAPPPGRGKRSTDQIIRTLRARPRHSAGAALLVLAMIAGIAYLAWPTTHHGYQPATRTRTYTSYTACLLTDATGITGTAAPVWAGMQAASHSTHEQVSYLTMQGADTAANADTYINTLALRGCDTILAAGTLPDQGVTDRAGAYPKLRFITIAASATVGTAGAASPTTPPTSRPANVTTITETNVAGTSAAVQTVLIHADPIATGIAGTTDAPK
jgi:hypothetical protein